MGYRYTQDCDDKRIRKVFIVLDGISGVSHWSGIQDLNPQILDTPLESTERLLKGKMTMPQELTTFWRGHAMSPLVKS
jgi:hypothetical protein